MDGFAPIGARVGISLCGCMGTGSEKSKNNIDVAIKSCLKSSSQHHHTANTAQATRNFLETTILVPICLLPDLNGPLSTASPSVLVKEVLLPNIQRGIQLQIDAAKDCADLLGQVRSCAYVGARTQSLVRRTFVLSLFIPIPRYLLFRFIPPSA